MTAWDHAAVAKHAVDIPDSLAIGQLLRSEAVAFATDSATPLFRENRSFGRRAPQLQQYRPELVDSLDDHRIRALLDVAIRGKGASRRFKDVLHDYPEQRERWFAFHKDRAHGRVRRWLEGEDIAPIIT